MSSSWEYILQGDIEAAIIQTLNSASEVTSFAGGAPTVSSDLQGYQRGARWITVVRQGGAMEWPRIDRPRVDFNVFGETRSATHDLAQVAQAVMFRSMGTAYPSLGLFVSDVKMETGIFRAPDPPTGSHRYIFALRFTCVPH